MRDKGMTGYLSAAALCEQDGDVVGWQTAIIRQVLGGPRFLPVEIDVSESFYFKLLASMDAITLPDGKIKFYGIPIVIREDLPFALEVA